MHTQLITSCDATRFYDRLEGLQKDGYVPIPETFRLVATHPGIQFAILVKKG